MTIYQFDTSKQNLIKVTYNISKRFPDFSEHKILIEYNAIKSELRQHRLVAYQLSAYDWENNDIFSYKNKVWRAGLSWIFRARMAWWSHLQARRRQDEILRKRPRKQIWVHFLVKVATLAYFHISSMLNPKMWVAKFSFDQKVLNFHF